MLATTAEWKLLLTLLMLHTFTMDYHDDDYDSRLLLQCNWVRRHFMFEIKFYFLGEFNNFRFWIFLTLFPADEVSFKTFTNQTHTWYKWILNYIYFMAIGNFKSDEFNFQIYNLWLVHNGAQQWRRKLFYTIW